MFTGFKLRHVAHLYTTPHELRVLADDMEDKWKTVQLNDSVIVQTIFGDDVDIEIRYNQSKMKLGYSK